MRRFLIGIALLLLSLLVAMPGLSQSWEVESNNSRSQADYVAHIPGSGCRRGTIGSVGDIDYYRFTVTTTVLVYIKTITEDDTVIALQDSQGRAIAEDDDSGGGSGSMITSNLGPGMYYVAVWEYGNDETAGDYRLLISSSGHSDESEGNDDIWSANPIGSLPGVIAVSGSVDPSDVDWFRFEVSNSTRSYVTTITGGDTVIALYNSSGTRLIEDDDWGDTRWSLISEYSLNRGTYYLMVWEYGNDAPIDLYILLAGPSYATETGTNDRREHSDHVALDSGAGMVRGSITSQNGVDWYSFHLNSDAMVTLSSYSAEDTVLILYDESGTLLVENDDVTPGIRWSQIEQFLVAGPYYVAVTPYQGGTISSYVLTVMPH